MKVILIIISFALLFALIVCLYVLVRNNKTYNFRMYILDCIYNNYKSEDYFRYISLYNKYSYEDILYSFKPLKLKYWYSEEEIKILKGIKQ